MASITENLIQDVQINQESPARIAASAYGICTTASSTADKTVEMTGFSLMQGVTIHVKFTHGNTALSARLSVENSGLHPIIVHEGSSAPDPIWQDGAIVAFTYDGNNWVMNTGIDTENTSVIYNTYSATSEDPISGKGVKAALETLDITAISNTANKTVATITEQDGIVGATFQNIEITESQVLNPTDNTKTLVDDLAAKAPINNPTFTGSITLPATGPQSDNEAATKKYVDSAITNVNENGVVLQTITSDNKNYRILFSGTDDDITRAEGVRKDGDLLYNPSTNILSIGTGILSATNYSGKAATAGIADEVAWSGITSKPATATRWPKWSEIAAGAHELTEISTNITDHTELLSSYASNNGFADTNGEGVVYKVDAIRLYNYIKSKTDSIYATQEMVNGLVSAADAMIFKGTIGNGGTVNDLPAYGYSVGWTYKVITAARYANIPCEVGDLIIAIANAEDGQTQVINGHWTVAQTNIDGAVTGPVSSTLGDIVIFSGDTGKTIYDSGKAFNTDAPSATSTDAQIPTSKAVWDVIDALDVLDISGFGAGKTLATLTETNGKIAATFQNISITKSQISDFTHTHDYAGATVAGGPATYAITTTNNADALYLVGIKNGEPNTLLHNSHILIKGNDLNINDGTIYFGKNATNKAILAFNAENTTSGIWYHEGTPDVMRFSASGNANTAAADFAINALGEGTLSNRNHMIPHTGNTTGTIGNVNAPVYVENGEIKVCTTYANASVNYATTAGSATTANSATTAGTATNLVAAPTIVQGGTSAVDIMASTVYTLSVGGQSVAFKVIAGSAESDGSAGIRVYADMVAVNAYNGEYPLLIGRTPAANLTASANDNVFAILNNTDRTKIPTFNPYTGEMKIPSITLKTGLYPDTNNTGSIGTSSYVWNEIYATTFYGNLSGNATTITGGLSTANTASPIWFSYSETTGTYINGKLGYNTNFTYNPTTRNINFGDAAIISTTSGTGNNLTLDSGDLLFLNKSASSSIIFTTGGASTTYETMRVNANGTLVVGISYSGSGDRDTPSGAMYVEGDSTFKGDLVFPSANKFDWNTGTYRQRITVTDDNTTNTAVFKFQQSSNSGTNYSDLLVIRDNGTIVPKKVLIEHEASSMGEIRVIYSTTIDYWWGIGSDNTTHGLYDEKANAWILSASSDNIWTLNGRATYDGSGNTITSYYCTLSTVQTITANKTFTGNLYWGASGAGGYLNGSATEGGKNSILIGDDIWLGSCNTNGILSLRPEDENTNICGFYFYLNDGTAIGQLYANTSAQIYSNCEFRSNSANGFRLSNGNYGVILRNDGSNYQFLITNSGYAATGTWNNLRPFSFDLTTGNVTMEHDVSVKKLIVTTADAGSIILKRVNNPNWIWADGASSSIAFCVNSSLASAAASFKIEPTAVTGFNDNYVDLGTSIVQWKAVYAYKFIVETNVTLQWNSTDSSLDFVFT